MSDIYVNVETGKKIRVYQETWVHVYDHDDPRDILDFWDTAKGVASWCIENLESVDLEDDEKCEYCGGDCPHHESSFDEAEREENQCEQYLDDDEEYYSDLKKYHRIQEAYEDVDYLEVIELEGCRHCEWEIEDRWVVEEIKDE